MLQFFWHSIVPCTQPRGRGVPAPGHRVLHQRCVWLQQRVRCAHTWVGHRHAAAEWVPACKHACVRCFLCTRSADGGHAEIYLKREDLNHTGAHKINNSLGQALLCKRMGKKRIIAETGAGQHGVATVGAGGQCACMHMCAVPCYGHTWCDMM